MDMLLFHCREFRIRIMNEDNNEQLMGGCCHRSTQEQHYRCSHQSLLSMASNDDNDDSMSPQETLQKAVDDFFSSSSNRTLLFAAPFLFKPKLREIVPTPAMVLAVAAILVYSTYEMRDSEIKDRWVPKRNTALRELKGARADRLSNADMEAARHAYETALRKECQARVLLPSL